MAIASLGFLLVCIAFACYCRHGAGRDHVRGVEFHGRHTCDTNAQSEHSLKWCFCRAVFVDSVAVNAFLVDVTCLMLVRKFERIAQVAPSTLSYAVRSCRGSKELSFLYFPRERNCQTTCQQELRIFPSSFHGPLLRLSRQ